MSCSTICADVARLYSNDGPSKAPTKHAPTKHGSILCFRQSLRAWRYGIGGLALPPGLSSLATRGSTNYYNKLGSAWCPVVPGSPGSPPHAPACPDMAAGTIRNRGVKPQKITLKYTISGLVLQFMSKSFCLNPPPPTYLPGHPPTYRSHTGLAGLTWRGGAPAAPPQVTGLPLAGGPPPRFRTPQRSRPSPSWSSFSPTFPRLRRAKATPLPLFYGFH